MQGEFCEIEQGIEEVAEDCNKTCAEYGPFNRDKSCK